MKKHVVKVRTNKGTYDLADLATTPNVGYVSRVVWSDGNESWGKSWTRWDEEAQVHWTVMVGAGAYGDFIVWTRERGDFKKEI